MLVLQPGVTKTEEEAPSLKSLITDPYIIIASGWQLLKLIWRHEVKIKLCSFLKGAITFANMGIAMLEPSLPIFMMDRMDAEKWQIGATFLPASISYLIGTNLFGPLGHRMGRWLASFVGLTIIGLALICVRFSMFKECVLILWSNWCRQESRQEENQRSKSELSVTHSTWLWWDTIIFASQPPWVSDKGLNKSANDNFQRIWSFLVRMNLMWLVI